MFGTSRVNPVINVSSEDFNIEYMSSHKDEITHMSISGVQLKKTVKLIDGEVVSSSERTTHILKPSPESYANLAVAEHLCMLMAREYKIEIPEVGLFKLTDGSLAYLIARFDRNLTGDRILHTEDMAGILGLRSEDKYAASYEDVLEGVKKATSNKLYLVCEALQRVIFSYFILNGDMHVKNLSLTKKVGDTTYTALSPGYDFVPSSIYIEDEERLALDLLKDEAFTDAYMQYGFYTKADFVELGHRLGVQPAVVDMYVKNILKLQAKFIGMIEESLLSDQQKAAFIAGINDRAKALSY